ncbi:MAG: alpha/beta hydrolase, partial [Pseudomonadota bacterium]|nr:alpha/beta hydrolase [Pseudomonadota bacterium]
MARWSFPLVASAFLGAAAAAAPAAAVSWTRCELPGVEGAAECARIAVPESRLGRSPRWLNLRVARLLPLEGAGEPDPIVILQGGPGQSAVSLADFYGGESWRLAREKRVILLVDQRGTGESNPLNCDLGGRDEDPQSWFYELFPDEQIRRCRAELAARADMREYTTEQAVLDLEEVRRRLGYQRLNLYGTSYGTRVALRYLDAFPERVRSVILKGVVEPEAVVPVSFERDTERALDLLISDCAADAACRAAYPDLRRDYERMRARLAQGPVTASLEVNGARTPVVLTPGVVSSSFRSFLQATPAAAQMPRMIA